MKAKGRMLARIAHECNGCYYFKTVNVANVAEIGTCHKYQQVLYHTLRLTKCVRDYPNGFAFIAVEADKQAEIERRVGQKVMEWMGQYSTGAGTIWPWTKISALLEDATKEVEDEI